MIGIIVLGVWYTSVFAPNILLVNIKEMYTNDLTDATVALNTYYWKMMNYKLGHSNCSEPQSIKCKLSTMSRAQKQAFEKSGFTVLGTNDGPLGSLKPTGRKMSLPFCEICHFDKEGHVVSGSCYYDQYTLLTQLGHIPPNVAAA